MGYCLYGNELNEQTTTIEAGLSWITKHETSFIGSNSMQDNLPSKKLIALISEERAIPRSGYKIFSKDKKGSGRSYKRRDVSVFKKRNCSCLC